MIKIELNEWNDLNTDCRVWLGETIYFLKENDDTQNIKSALIEEVETSTFLQCEDKLELMHFIETGLIDKYL